ncbi:hypothetical protein [Rhizobium sp. Leaf383]|uniref:hypothetical protein n=1 Tax=Rhizobium sp. Leaf383 TaxID=1736357 RepID=UPI00071376AB|nr:hypothetical protein [Rhizobium sp. Leaf383]KQS76370.1 hypothetical protein ASG58_11105 [Rhizobium sp. Leaf383]
MNIDTQAVRDTTAQNTGSVRSFYPSSTVRCDGNTVFRSQAARDVACLLDLDTFVVRWRCTPTKIADLSHTADFEAVQEDGTTVLVDAHDRELPTDIKHLETAARRQNLSYRQMTREEVHDGFRLRNAKDLLRYGNYVVPLGDRLRLLGALDANGSMSISECLNAFQEVKPVAGLASLILHRYLEVDLDDAPLGPETMVRRIAR